LWYSDASPDWNTLGIGGISLVSYLLFWQKFSPEFTSGIRLSVLLSIKIKPECMSYHSFIRTLKPALTVYYTTHTARSVSVSKPVLVVFPILLFHVVFAKEVVVFVACPINHVGRE